MLLLCLISSNIFSDSFYSLGSLAVGTAILGTCYAKNSFACFYPKNYLEKLIDENNTPQQEKKRLKKMKKLSVGKSFVCFTKETRGVGYLGFAAVFYGLYKTEWMQDIIYPGMDMLFNVN